MFRTTCLSWILLSTSAFAQIQSLDGTWQLHRGEETSPPAATAAWETVAVPWLLDQVNDKPQLWYRRSFSVPGEWAGRRLFLRFEAVRFVTEVYVDGRKLGGHVGGWEPFEVEATAACSPGKTHELLVRVQDVTGVCEQAMDYDKQGQGVRFISQAKNTIMHPIGSQYTRIGIWQSVSLVARGDLFIEDVFVKTSLRRKEIGAEITVRNLGTQPRKIRCTAAVEGAVTLKPADVAVPGGGSQTVTLSHAWPDPRLWGPDDPHLYQLQTSVESGGQTLDRCSTRFGFREFWTDGTDLVLNGTPMKFLATAGHPRGTFDGDLGKPAAIDFYRRIRETGCVGMRLHANIWPRWWYDAADEVGMPIIFESALFCWAESYALTRDEFWNNYHEHLRAVIRAHRNHPSIVMTSLENEILHCGGGRRVPETEHRLAEAGRMVKAFDPTRPILYDGDGDPEGVADVVNLHYPLDFNRRNLWPTAGYWLETGMDVACLPHAFWTWDRKKPLYFGEFLHLQHFTEADPYSTLLGDEAYCGHNQAMARAKAIAWEMQIEAYRACGLSGMCPWTLTETGPFPSDDNPRYMAVKRAYEKNAAFVREYDTRFYAGEEVQRTVYLYNDTARATTLRCSWELSQKGTVPICRNGPEGASHKWGLSPFCQGSRSEELGPARSAQFAIRLNIPKVEKRTDVSLTLRVHDGDRLVYERSLPYAVFPRRALTVPKGLTLAVFGELGGDLARRLHESDCAIQRLERLDQPPKDGVLLIAPHALDKLPAPEGLPVVGQAGPRQALDQFVARGGSVIVLEQDTYGEALPAALTDRACTIAFRRSHDGNLLRDTTDADFRFWRGDHVVARATIRKPTAGRFRVLVDSGGREGLVYVPLLEIDRGRGRYLLCQLAVAEKLADEPIAQQILENLLATAAKTLPAPRRLGLVQAKLPLGTSLGEIDALFTDLSGKLDKADLGQFQALLLETDSPETAAQQKKLGQWLRDGGRAILHGGTPEGLARLASILPEPMALQASTSTPVNIAQADAVIDGLSNQELYWYKDRRGLNYRVNTPLAPVADFAVVAAPPEQAQWTTIEAESMTPVNGKPQVRADEVYMYRAGSLETGIQVPAAGEYAIALRMKGTSLGGVFPHVAVAIDNRRCGVVAVRGKDWDISWCNVPIPEGNHSLRLSFINDESNPETKEDRNLAIDKIQWTAVASLKSPRLLSPAALVKVPVGKGFLLIDQVRWDADACRSEKAARYLSNLLFNLGCDFGSAAAGVTIFGDKFVPQRESPALSVRSGRAYLGTNGTMLCKLSFARPGRWQFRIRASGTPAEGQLPIVALSIDGKRVGEATLLQREWHTLVLEADVDAGPHEIGLSLTNDLYRPPEDRNLVIAWLEIR